MPRGSSQPYICIEPSLTNQKKSKNKNSVKNCCCCCLWQIFKRNWFKKCISMGLNQQFQFWDGRSFPAQVIWGGRLGLARSLPWQQDRALGHASGAAQSVWCQTDSPDQGCLGTVLPTLALLPNWNCSVLSPICSGARCLYVMKIFGIPKNVKRSSIYPKTPEKLHLSGNLT